MPVVIDWAAAPRVEPAAAAQGADANPAPKAAGEAPLPRVRADTTAANWQRASSTISAPAPNGCSPMRACGCICRWRHSRRSGSAGCEGGRRSPPGSGGGPTAQVSGRHR